MDAVVDEQEWASGSSLEWTRVAGGNAVSNAATEPTGSAADTGLIRLTLNHLRQAPSAQSEPSTEVTRRVFFAHTSATIIRVKRVAAFCQSLTDEDEWFRAPQIPIFTSGIGPFPGHHGRCSRSSWTLFPVIMDVVPGHRGRPIVAVNPLGDSLDPLGRRPESQFDAHSFSV